MSSSSSSSSSSSCCWLPIPADSDFSVSNLPYGVFSPSLSSSSLLSSGGGGGGGGVGLARTTNSVVIEPRCGTILGNTVIDLSVLQNAGLFDCVENLSAGVFSKSCLNDFAKHPKRVWSDVRKRLLCLFRTTTGDDRDGGDDMVLDPILRTNERLQRAAFYAISDVTMHLPVRVGDYTDFYSSREHAANMGMILRGGTADNALQPNWLHLPVGYHGRSSTVFVSGRAVRRPCGQLQKDGDDAKRGSVYGPCRRMDFELEMAAVVGGPANGPGEPISISRAKDRLFGFVLMNDWSARDLQKWEYVPLGPFTSKNFATTISPWIVPADALTDFVAPTSAVQQSDPVPLPYLQDSEYSSYDIQLTVDIQSDHDGTSIQKTVCRSNFTNLYWNVAQQLAHHSVSGCIMNAGDLLGSGTISGLQPDSFGSMMELSWKGTRDVVVGDGDHHHQVRRFLNDGDTVIMKGWCQKKKDDGDGSVAGVHHRVGFGECIGTVLPALTDMERESLAAAAPPVKQAAEEDRYSDFTLYGYWRSSSTWRVRIAMAAKSIPYATVPVDLYKGENKTENFLSKNPLGQVPVLEFTDTLTGKLLHLTQSVAIIEFLDQVFPTRPSLLIPKDPFERASAYEMVELINAGTQPLQNAFFLDRLEKVSDGKMKGDEIAKDVIVRGLKALELLVLSRRRRQSGTTSSSSPIGGGEVSSEERSLSLSLSSSSPPLGPYCLGGFAPTIVDAFLVPQMYNARCRFGIDVDEICPCLAEIHAQCVNHHPWFQSTHPRVQPDAPPQRAC